MDTINRQFRLTMILIITALTILSFASPAMAWIASVNVASVEGTYSPYMGSYDPANYPNQHFANVPATSISATTLAQYDTILFFSFNPSKLSSSQKTDINNWILNGGKLIIWDSEDSAYTSTGFDYSWLPDPFKSTGPGAWGAMGYPLTITEDNQLNSNDPSSPYYIDVDHLSHDTDAVGDAAVFTTLSSGWTESMDAKNALGMQGPVHVYSQPGKGCVIYCGLDWDYGSGGYYGDQTLIKLMRQELDASYLPSGSTWTGNLNVVKVSDKSQYQVGDPITFTVTVENPATNQYTAEGVVLTDMPPAEISVPTTTYTLGNIAPGQSVTQTITATATASGTGIKNEVNALGYYQSKPVFSGSSFVTIDILSQPSNLPPIAEAKGSYTGDEGSLITFDASGSSDPEGSSLTYEWDFDNDGIFEVSSSEPSATHSWADDYTGTVTLRVTDKEGLTSTDTADVKVNNVAPDAREINSPVDPVQIGATVTVDSDFTDAGVLDIHTAVWEWGDDTTSDGSITENSGLGTISGTHTYSAAGIYEIKMTVTDDDSGSDYSVSNWVVIYDPQGGFVTGGGLINSPAGAYVKDNTLAGKATFGFVSKYQKGANVPTGNTEFQFKVANLNFHSENYDWLVVAGSQAKFKGTGTINGEGNYGFMLSAVDGSIDKFRIKIWDKESGNTVYDNEIGAAEDAEPSTAISSGSIVIHKEK